MRLFLLFIVLAVIVSAKVEYGSVQYDIETDSFTFKSHDKAPSLEDVTAYARWEETLLEEGWSKFHVYTNKDFTDSVQVRAAGYLEGTLQWMPLFLHRKNYLAYQKEEETFTDDVRNFLAENLVFIRENINKYKLVDSYWAQVALVVAQFDGLVEGYHFACPKNKCPQYLTEYQLWEYQAFGDVMEILSKFKVKMPAHLEETMFEHCSALVRLTSDYTQLYVSQVAWFFYGSMSRVLKVYNFELTTTGTQRSKLSFSSYPGFLFSFDDFYVLEDKVAVFETTHHSDNKTLEKYIVPETIPTWLRVVVSNRMAKDGDHWGTVFGRYNSGTYNNILPPVSPPKEGLVTVIEQIPGHVFKNDNSTQLESQGYIPSYNTPSLLATRKLANLTNSLWSGWDTAGRGKTFAREAIEVDNLAGMKELMRYNNREEEEADFNAFAISSRYDLRKDEKIQKAFGALDVKIVDQRTIEHMWFHAIAGPTTSHKAPVWNFTEWEDKKEKSFHVPHEGVPEVFNFDWLMFGPVEQCIGLDVDSCFEAKSCGWCKQFDKCVAGDNMGAFEACKFEDYQFASKAGIYLLMGIVAALCIVLIAVCWIWGCQEKKTYERKLLAGNVV
ncbi:hypothetical protein GEMRC1_003116 [Eukaryota sp. GEM-RC1]